MNARNVLAKQIAALKKEMPIIPTTLGRARTRDAAHHAYPSRRRFSAQGRRVTPGVPSVLPPLPAKGKPTRLDLAKWLVDPKNPLTARVTVNRMWQAYFGLGFVETENDFGTQGTPPSHPELLDWLASEFVARQWDHEGDAQADRLLGDVSASVEGAARPGDARPANRLLARQSRLRLEAEDSARRRIDGERPADADGRRAERLPAAAAGRLRLHAGAARLEGQRRPRPLPPRHVYLLLALGPAPGTDRVRRPGLHHGLHAPQPFQHAACRR